MEWILVIGLTLVMFYFTYDYLKGKFRNKQLIAKLNATECDLTNAKDDIETLKEELHGLQHKLNQTLEDPVTKLIGWQLFEDRVKHCIKECERYELNLGILMVDIDDFKVVNDAWSYQAGNELLCEVARRITANVRQVDSVTRFAKDTFVVLLTQLAKPETAAIVAQRILQALLQPIEIKGNELYITACVGIALYPVDGRESFELLRSADHALHLAKRKGRHEYQFYQARLHDKSQRELALHTKLCSEALFQELTVYYQPIIDVQAQSMTGIDVTVSWSHTDFGLVDSDEIYTIADRQQKLNHITEWVFRTACTQFMFWRSHGSTPAFLSFSISCKQLENSHFILRISQIMQELQFKPEWLMLKIRDDAQQIAQDALEKAFNMLKYLGVKIVVDFFGPGCCSIRYVKGLGIHYLKIDKSLISDMGSNKQTVEIIKSLVAIAASLSVQIIVEGVETQEQINVLKGLGCVYMQGQFLGAAMTESDMTAKMAATSSV